jgi:RNA polymerase sigma factor (sigma-70 family)
MTETDLDLLHRFVCDQSQDAFSELVQRHLNLVYCAALRQVRSPQLAQEVAQSVFADLARTAARLRPDTVLTAWLYEVTRRTAINVVRSEARRRIREQVASEMNAMNANTDHWLQIEPLLDEAMHALEEEDRTAILLRYFENKSLRDVGSAIGTTDDTARKRLNRAIEKLRQFLAKRGANIAANGLIVIISANAASSAPAGLAFAITTHAILAVIPATTGALATAQTTTMALLQKALVTGLFVSTMGIAVYEAHNASTLRKKIESLEQVQAASIEQLTLERDEAKHQLAASRSNSNRDANLTELARLRGEVTRLRFDAQEIARFKSLSATKRAATVSAILVTNVNPHAVTEEQVRAVIKTRIGEPYNAVDIDRDVRALYAAGVFSNVRVVQDNNELGITLTYMVKEKGESAPAQQAFGTELRDMGTATPEHAASSLIWAALSGTRSRFPELLELPANVPEPDAAKHYDYFARSLSNSFSSKEFLSIENIKPNPDGTLRLNQVYRDKQTGKLYPFPFMVRLHESGWKVVVEEDQPR